MSTNTHNSDASELKSVALPADARHLGRDTEKHDHYFVLGDDARVIVVDHTDGGADFVREQPLRERNLSEWVAFVEDRRGWDVCRYDDSPLTSWIFGQQLAAEIAELDDEGKDADADGEEEGAAQ